MIAQQEDVQKAMNVDRSTMTAVGQPDDLKLLVSATGTPWYKNFVQNIKEVINPPKLPPLEVTSKPIPVKNIWGDSKNTRTAGMSSVLIHGVGIVLLILIGTNKTVQQKVKESVHLIAPDIAPYVPAAPKKNVMGGWRWR
jgi:periplasmic protein TonB